MDSNEQSIKEFVDNLSGSICLIQTTMDSQFEELKPQILSAINSKMQNPELWEKLIDPLWDMMLMCPEAETLFFTAVDYLRTFNPPRADNYIEILEQLEGTFDIFVEKAKELAKELHKGQTDKQGVDYFEGHLQTVGACGCWKQRVVGYLHDAAEDTPYSVEQIISMLNERCGNPLREKDRKQIREALHLLNSKEAVSREAYIDGIKHSHLAISVKLRDLEHNMDLSRLANPTQKDIERTVRYKKEYYKILSYLGKVYWQWDETYTNRVSIKYE